MGEDKTDVDSYKWRAFTAIAISFVTQVMAMSMVFIALPPIADDFGITLRAVSWVVIAQALTISSMMMPFGRLGDMIGRRRLHLIGLVFFGVGAIAVALSPTFGILIAARIFMAIGNAMSQSVSTAMVVAVFPDEERGTAIGAQTTAVSVGGASGPLFAGLVLDVLSWQALFFIIAIPIVIAFLASWFILDEERVGGARGDGSSFDWTGALLSGAAMVVLIMAINNPVGLPWISLPMLAAAVVVVVLVVIFVRWELAQSTPMLQLRLFRNRVLTLASACRFVGFLVATAVRILLPILLISLRGLSALQAGAVLFVISVGMGISASASGRLSDRYGTKPFSVAGFVLLLATSIGFASISSTTSMVALVPLVFFSGVSMGLWNVPNNSMMMGSVPSSSHGVVGAFSNLTRTIGGVFGQAVATAVVAGVMVARGFDIPLSEIGETAGAEDAFLAGWRYACVLVSVFSAVGLGLALSNRPNDRRVPAAA